MGDDGLACQVGEGFSRKPLRSVPGRNDDGDSPQTGAPSYDEGSGNVNARDVKACNRSIRRTKPAGDRAARRPAPRCYGARVATVRVPFTVEANYDGWRLDRYLQEKLRRLAPERIEYLIAHRLEAEDGRALEPASPVSRGLRFALLREAEPEPETPLDFGVVLDDGDLLVVDKPAGLPVHPTARYLAHTLTTLARARFPGRKIDPAHRLDRETSGLLVCGTRPEVTRILKRDFAQGRVEKTYLAIVLGAPREERFTVEVPLALTGASVVRVRMHADPAGLASFTGFEVLERRAAADGAPVALLSCRPRTGRQHQIRAHLHCAGLHLVGDKIYGPDETIFDRFTKGEMTAADRERLRLPRQALHAWRLELPHPLTRAKVLLEAPLPPDLKAFWEGCRPAPAAGP
jgi:23S rRNA pseudouridine1911/1915/1917 synthase